MSSNASNSPVLLYDSSCGFCNSTVQMILRHDSHDTLRFAAVQSSYGADVIRRHKELQDVDSVIWVEPAYEQHPERVRIRSSAAMQIARYLGGWWRLALIGRIIPRPVRDWGYDLVAKNRHRISNVVDHCMILQPKERERFIEF